MKSRIWKSDLLNHAWGLKAYGQRDDAVKADENRFWNKLWHNEYSDYVPAFGWYFLMMSYLSFSKLSHNSSSWKQMSIHIVFCHIFWNSLKFCKTFRWKHNERQNVCIRWPMENYNPGHSILHSSQLQSFSYITETLAGHLYGSDWEAEIHMLLNCSVLHSSHGKTNHRWSD